MNNTEYIDSLYEEMAVLKLKLAFAESEAEQSAVPPELPEDMPAVLPEPVERALRGARVRHILTEALPKFGRAAAAVLLVFYVGLTAAAAFAEPVRNGIARFIASDDGGYMNIGYEQDPEPPIDSMPEVDPALTAPEGWAGDTYIRYIPDGYALEKVSTYYDEALYVNSTGERFLFAEYPQSVHIQLNGSADTISVSVNGQPGFCSRSRGETCVMWPLHGKVMVIRLSTDDMNTAVAIAESVRRLPQ